MRSSKRIIKSISQKLMAKFGVGRRFHDLKIFWCWIFFFIFLEFIIHLRATLQKFVEKHQFKSNIISNFSLKMRKTCVQYIYLHTTWPPPKLCIHFLKISIYVNINCLVLHINMFPKCLRFFPSQNSKLVYSVRLLSLKTYEG